MATILLPIKPEYVEKILSGQKKYEYRKRVPQKRVDRILIYCTSPVMKVVGSVEVVDLLEETPRILWEKTMDYGGISKKKYFDYFSSLPNGYAYELGKIEKFDEPKPLSDYGINYHPQSFLYLEA